MPSSDGCAGQDLGDAVELAQRLLVGGELVRVERLPSVERSSTWVGSVAPAGKPFSRVLSATADSAVPEVPLDPRSKVGLKDRAAIASRASTPPEASA